MSIKFPAWSARLKFCREIMRASWWTVINVSGADIISHKQMRPVEMRWEHGNALDLTKVQ